MSYATHRLIVYVPRDASGSATVLNSYIAAYDKVGSVVFFTPQHDMNVRVIGVVMAHGEVCQLRLKVALNLRHEVISERFEVKVLAFLRAQNEPEVVPIVGPIGDRMAQIRALNSAPIERYLCLFPAFPDAIPHQIPYMLEESVDCFRAATSSAKASFEDDALVQTAPGTNELSNAEMSSSASCSERRSDRGRHRKVVLFARLPGRQPHN